MPDGEVKGKKGTGEQQWHLLLGVTSLPCSGALLPHPTHQDPPCAEQVNSAQWSRVFPVPFQHQISLFLLSLELQGPVGTTVGA